jgi:hypothetical protein
MVSLQTLESSTEVEGWRTIRRNARQQITVNRYSWIWRTRRHAAIENFPCQSWISADTLNGYEISVNLLEYL